MHESTTPLHLVPQLLIDSVSKSPRLAAIVMFQHTCLLSYKRSAVLRHVRDVVKEAQVGCNSRMFAFVAVFGRSAGRRSAWWRDRRRRAAVSARERRARALMLGGRNNDVYFRRRVAPMHHNEEKFLLC